MDQILLLQEKGYGEFKLHANSPHNYLIEHLQERFNEVLPYKDNSILPVNLKVETLGEFNQGRDTIPLLFEYLIDFHKNTIQLYSIKGDLDGIEQTYFPKNGRDMPTPPQLFEALTQHIEKRYQGEHFGDKNAINPPLDEKELKVKLIHLGYLWNNPQSIKEDSRAIKQIVKMFAEKNLGVPWETEKWELPMTIPFKNGQYKVQNNFLLSHRSDMAKASITGLTARLNDEKVSYNLTKTESIPRAKQVFEVLESKLRISHAKKFSTEQSKSKKHRL